jgi:two-component system sensor histidine kinase EvgS
VPEDEKQELYRLWQPDRIDLAQGQNPFLYRARERVDQKHPVVNVLIYSQDNAAPVSFIDNKGVLRGIAADLFSVVSLRTGLQFRFETGSTTEELIQKVNESSADMLASITPSEARKTKYSSPAPICAVPFPWQQRQIVTTFICWQTCVASGWQW